MEFTMTMLLRKMPQAATVLLLTGASAVATAQTLASDRAPAATEQSTDADAATVDVITVTAEKRTERIQDVPISINAVSGNTISSDIRIECCHPRALRMAPRVSRAAFRDFVDEAFRREPALLARMGFLNLINEPR